MKGWQTKRLGEVLCKTETVNPAQKPNDLIDYIDVSSVSKTSLEIVETQRITGKDAPSRARRLVRANDVIFATIRPTLMRIAIVPEHLDGQVCSTGYFIVRTNPELNFRFAYYFLQTQGFMNAMECLQKGASYPAVTDGDVKRQPIPIPPLDEQRRIVAILDEAFAGVATAKANTEKNLQNARALFESHLNEVFTKMGDCWVEKRLAKASGGIFTGPFGSLLHKSDYIPNGIPLINPAHITTTGVVPDFSKTVSQETAKRLEQYVLHSGDIVIGRRGEMGRCALITDAENGWLCGTGSFYIKPSNQCEPRFLVAFLRSEKSKRRLEKLAGGAVMPNLSNAVLSDFPVSFPPLPEQQRIVAELDALSAETRRLEAIFTSFQHSLYQSA